MEFLNRIFILLFQIFLAKLNYHCNWKRREQYEKSNEFFDSDNLLDMGYERKLYISIVNDRKKELSSTEISKKYCIDLSIKIESY